MADKAAAELTRLLIETGIDLSTLPIMATTRELAPVLGTTVNGLAMDRFRKGRSALHQDGPEGPLSAGRRLPLAAGAPARASRDMTKAKPPGDDRRLGMGIPQPNITPSRDTGGCPG